MKLRLHVFDERTGHRRTEIPNSNLIINVLIGQISSMQTTLANE